MRYSPFLLFVFATVFGEAPHNASDWSIEIQTEKIQLLCTLRYSGQKPVQIVSTDYGRILEPQVLLRGEPVGMTAFGRDQFIYVRPPSGRVLRSVKRFNTGAVFKYPYHLNRLFDMSRRGEYSVLVVKKLPVAEGQYETVKSNTLYLRIAEEEEMQLSPKAREQLWKSETERIEREKKERSKAN